MDFVIGFTYGNHRETTDDIILPSEIREAVLCQSPDKYTRIIKRYPNPDQVIGDTCRRIDRCTDSSRTRREGGTTHTFSLVGEYSRERELLISAGTFHRAPPTLETVGDDRSQIGLPAQGQKSEVRGKPDSGIVEKLGSRLQPGHARVPWDNGYAECFQAGFRAKFLSREQFFSMREVSAMLEDWRQHYNRERPHVAYPRRRCRNPRSKKITRKEENQLGEVELIDALPHGSKNVPSEVSKG